VRDLEGEPVRQAVLGGDTGVPLREMLVAAALLKSKRVPSDLDFLVACASRQTMEVLAHSGALVDLIATGARLVEPDHRLLSGQLYGPPREGLSIRTYDPEPGQAEGAGFVIASAETLAYAVASGHIGDPRGFKRPVRITVPRALPTEDVLVVRKQRSKKKKKRNAEGKGPSSVAPAACLATWCKAEPLGVVTCLRIPTEPSAFVAGNLHEVGWFARRASSVVPALKVVVAPFVPSGWVTLFSTCGILSLHATEGQLSRLQKAKALTVTSPERWQDCVPIDVDGETLELRWSATPEERHWAVHGTSLVECTRQG
jgi:aconitate hydratase